MRALILTWTGFQDHEVIYPYYRLKGAGFDVQIAADKRDERGRFYGIYGCNMPCDIIIEKQPLPGDVDLLVLPGGVKALEMVRQKWEVVGYVRQHYEAKGIIASTCHGAQLLISAGVCEGNAIASYPSIKDDVNNAGGIWTGDPVVVSNNIVSSPHYDFMGPWMERAIAEVYKRA